MDYTLSRTFIDAAFSTIKSSTYIKKLIGKCLRLHSYLNKKILSFNKRIDLMLAQVPRFQSYHHKVNIYTSCVCWIIFLGIYANNALCKFQFTQDKTPNMLGYCTFFTDTLMYTKLQPLPATFSAFWVKMSLSSPSTISKLKIY